MSDLRLVHEAMNGKRVRCGGRPSAVALRPSTVLGLRCLACRLGRWLGSRHGVGRFFVDTQSMSAKPLAII